MNTTLEIAPNAAFVLGVDRGSSEPVFTPPMNNSVYRAKQAWMVYFGWSGEWFIKKVKDRESLVHDEKEWPILGCKFKISASDLDMLLTHDEAFIRKVASLISLRLEN